jgi:hypothetical protein
LPGLAQTIRDQIRDVASAYGAMPAQKYQFVMDTLYTHQRGFHRLA